MAGDVLGRIWTRKKKGGAKNIEKRPDVRDSHQWITLPSIEFHKLYRLPMDGRLEQALVRCMLF